MSMSMSTFLKSQKAFLLALDPLRQFSVDLNLNYNKKVSIQYMHSDWLKQYVLTKTELR